ncbi:MAG: ELWxxDGT repeat protein [Planctomycetota bacterium]
MALTVLATLTPVPAPAQQPTLLRDINTVGQKNESSFPGTGVRMGAFLFFPARKLQPDGRNTGIELFRTLGVPATTTLVKDIWPGPLHSTPINLTVVGGKTLFFQASSNFQGGLWKSDGTPSGTVPVMAGIKLTSPVAFNGKLYFLHAGALWTSDGTTAGTVVVKQFTASFLVPTPDQLVVMGNSLYLNGATAATGHEIWKSDGTPSGTVLLKDIVAGTTGSGASNFKVAGSTLYFTAGTNSHGVELWKSDGTTQGTVLVKDVRPGPASSFQTMILRQFLPVVLTPAGKYLYFMANDGATGAELWRTDGTAAGTIQLKDIKPGNDPNGFTNSSVPQVMVALGTGNTLLFVADDGKIGRELYISDGTQQGTMLLKDIYPGMSTTFAPNQSSPRDFLAVGNIAYFAARDGNGEELWRSDGTANGTFLVRDIQPGKLSSGPGSFAVTVNGKVMFAADDGVRGKELWVTDGTTSGTTLLEDIMRPPGGSSDPANPRFLTAAHGVTYFSAHDGIANGLWKTDGTPKGTMLVKSVNVGGRSLPKMGVVGNRLFFNADDASNGTELWVSDGTPAGTKLVTNIAPANGESFPEQLPAVSGLLYFGSHPKFMVALGDTVVFQATDGVAGTELWRSDGTNSGTVLLKDIRPGTTGGPSPKPLHSQPSRLTVFGHEAWFTAIDSNRPGLWKTDGTAKGTVKVKDIQVTELAVAGTTLFALTDRELWKASGFGATGVTRVKDLSAAPLHNPFAVHLTVVGDDVYFIADPNNQFNRRVIWKSDGTTTGTAPILDSQNQFVIPLPVGFPGEPWLVAAGSRKLYFDVGRTLSADRELWVSDGTKTGTRMVYDLWPGDPGSEPTFLTHAHGKLLFAANDGKVGNELWAVDVGGNAQELGSGCAAQNLPPALSASDPVLGGKMTVRLVRARGSATTVLAIGLPTPGPALASGACVLPVDYTRPHVLLFLPTDAAGTWQLNQTVPNDPSLNSLYLVLHAAQGPSATPPFGLDLSNAVYLQPGK